MRNDSKYLAAFAMLAKSTLAKTAQGSEAERAASNVDFPGDALSDPAILYRRRYAGDVLHLADEFMARYTVKSVIPAQNFNVGITDAGEVHAYERPAGEQLPQTDLRWLQTAVTCSESKQAE
jgi:hypothetical protein